MSAQGPLRSAMAYACALCAGKIRLSKQTWVSESTVNIRNGRHVILQAGERSPKPVCSCRPASTLEPPPPFQRCLCNAAGPKDTLKRQCHAPCDQQWQGMERSHLEPSYGVLLTKSCLVRFSCEASLQMSLMGLRQCWTWERWWTPFTWATGRTWSCAGCASPIAPAAMYTSPPRTCACAWPASLRYGPPSPSPSTAL